MKPRRSFLKLSTFLGLSSFLGANISKDEDKHLRLVLPTLVSVLMHMFPKESPLSLSSQEATERFLLGAIQEKSFDKDIREFIIKGAERMIALNKKTFLHMNTQEKEEALRAYEESSYGRTWLSRILVMGLEANLSDPIYGGNLNEQGWKALDSFAGMPRPKRRYIDV